MSVNPKQTSRYTNEQLQIIKNTFADRHEALFALRKYMLCLDLDFEEQKIIDSFNKEVWDVLRIGFLPEINGEMPLKQEVDLWMLANISEMTVEQAHPHIMAREFMEKYLKGVLSGKRRPA